MSYNSIWLFFTRCAAKFDIQILEIVYIYIINIPSPQMLVIMAPMSSNEELAYLKAQTTSRNMTMAYSKSNVHIFLPSHEIVVQ